MQSGTGITITNASVTSSGSSYIPTGTFINGPLGLSDGIIITTGDAINAELVGGSGYNASTELYLPGDPLIDALLGGGIPSNDAIVLTLTFDVDPTVNSVAFDFVFGSEEYPMYVGSYNDAFGVFLNGTQIVFDSNGEPINLGGEFFMTGAIQFPTDTNLEYNGSTGRLISQASVVAGSTGNVIKFIIADALDYSLDSGALISNFRGNTSIVTTPVTGIDTSTPTHTPFISSPTDTFTHTPTQTSTQTETPMTPYPTDTFTQTSTNTQTPTVTYTPTLSGATLRIVKKVTGDVPGVGSNIQYEIIIRNVSTVAAENIAIWDTLADNLSFAANYNSYISPVITGQYVYWDMSGYTLMPGDILMFEFDATLEYLSGNANVANYVSCDYNDAIHVGANRHVPIQSGVVLFPEKGTVVYPNPSVVGQVVKFANVIPGSDFKIYTISGELVYTLFNTDVYVEWPQINNHIQQVSAGVYFYIFTNMGEVFDKGKLLIKNKQ